MKKNAKGFTLIELLAVIVILAVIALIATPTILSMIDKSRKGAAEQSMQAYVNTIEKELLLDNMDKSELQYGTFSIVNPKQIAKRLVDASNTYTGDASPLSLEIKGDGPVGFGTPKSYDQQYVLVDETGAVVQAEMKFSSYYIFYSYDSTSTGTDTVICSSTKSFDDAKKQTKCSSITPKDIVTKTTTTP